MKLVSINIEINRHYDTVVEFFNTHKPDVICMQEVLSSDFEFFKKAFGYEGVYCSHTFVDNRPEYYKEGYGKSSGVAIFARNISDTGYKFYWGKEEYTTISFEDYKKDEENLQSYAYLWVDTKDDTGDTFRYCTTHFPVTKEGVSSAFQLEVVEAFLQQVVSLGEVVLCGDFNAPRGNETFASIVAKYRDCIPKHYITSIDNNLHRDGKNNIMLMVDGLFLSEGYRAADVSLIDAVSDHMAILATITKIASKA